MAHRDATHTRTLTRHRVTVAIQAATNPFRPRRAFLRSESNPFRVERGEFPRDSGAGASLVRSPRFRPKLRERFCHFSDPGSAVQGG